MKQTMRIFNNLVNSYENKNREEFDELCISSLSLDNDSYLHLLDLLEDRPDVSFAYDLIQAEYYLNHPDDYPDCVF